MDYTALLKVSIIILVFAGVDAISGILNRGNTEKLLKNLSTSRERRDFFLRWSAQLFLRYGIVSLCGLWLLGKFSVLWGTNLGYGMFNGRNQFLNLVGNLVLTLICTILFIFLLRRNIKRARAGDPRTLALLNRRFQKLAPDSVQSLMSPLDASERRANLLLSISAGMSEELFFRALLPMAAFSIINYYCGTGVFALLLFWLTAVLFVGFFALQHLYQGKRGVMFVLWLGGLNMLFFLCTGSILIPLVYHIAWDINSTYVISRMIEEAEPYRIK